MMEAVIILLILIGISILISIKYMLKTKQDLQVIIDEKNMAMYNGPKKLDTKVRGVKQ